MERKLQGEGGLVRLMISECGLLSEEEERYESIKDVKSRFWNL